MLIDWFTVAAQIVNFLILLALLKHFLYDRIIRAMEEREEKVRSRLEDAETKARESEQEAEKYRQKNRDIEEKRKEMMDKVREQAESQRKELTQKARHEVEDLRAKWQESVQRQKASFLRELKQMAGHQVYEVSRKALKDLADADVEEHVIRVFLKEMENMKKEEREKMAEAVKDSGGKAILRSGFEISSTQRRQITRVLHEKISEDAEVDYETDPEIVFGVVLKSGGEKLSWCLEGYLKTLEDKTREALETETRAGKEKERQKGEGGSQ